MPVAEREKDTTRSFLGTLALGYDTETSPIHDMRLTRAVSTIVGF